MLEVGTGSGYSAAVSRLLAREVIGIELQPVLAGRREAGARRGSAPATSRWSSATAAAACPSSAPFDAIAVHAAAPAPPGALLDQLVEGGRLVAPIAAGEADMLTVFRREGDGFASEEIGPCRFVPLLGEEGFRR